MTYEHRDKDVSYFANLKEEDSISLVNYFSDKEEENSLADYFLDEEEDNLGYEFDKEYTWGTTLTTDPGLKQNPGTDNKEEESVRLFVNCLGLYTRVTTLGCLTIIKNKK